MRRGMLYRTPKKVLSLPALVLYVWFSVLIKTCDADPLREERRILNRHGVEPLPVVLYPIVRREMLEVGTGEVMHASQNKQEWGSVGD